MAKFDVVEALRTNYDNGEVYRYEIMSSEGLVNGYSRAVEREIRNRRQLGRKLGFAAEHATARVNDMCCHLRNVKEEQFLADYRFYKKCVRKGLPMITVPWRSANSSCQLGWIQQVEHFREYLGNPIYRIGIEEVVLFEGNQFEFLEFDEWECLYDSCRYAHENGLDMEEVEPWLHLRNLTGGGHDRVAVRDTVLFLHKVFEGSAESLGRLGSLYWENLNYFANLIRLFDEEKRTAAAFILLDSLQEYEIRILGEHIPYNATESRRINGKPVTKTVTVNGIMRMLKRLKYEHAACIPYDEKKGYDEVAGNSSDLESKVLAELFEESFGRAPKAIPLLAIAMQEQQKNREEVVRNFSVRIFAALKEKAGMLAASRIIVRFGKEASKLLSLEKQVLQHLHHADDLTVAWVLRHRNTAAETLCSIIKVNAIDSASMSLAEAIKRVEKLRSEREMEALERKYGFEFKNQKFPEECSVTDNGSKAFVMQAGDTRMATVGYDTYCCQHLDGAGESAMMYGLLADNAGFWAIEKQHRIIAQAEIWEGTLDKKPVLCFDNIELADDRDFSYIKEVLRCWLKASKHSDIVMGTGCNVLTYGYQDANGVLNQPYCWQVPSPYTDARTGQIVWLKKGGVVA